TQAGPLAPAVRPATTLSPSTRGFGGTGSESGDYIDTDQSEGEPPQRPHASPRSRTGRRRQQQSAVPHGTTTTPVWTMQPQSAQAISTLGSYRVARTTSQRREGGCRTLTIPPRAI